MRRRFCRKKKSVYVRNHSFAVVGTFAGVGVTLFSVNFACFLYEEYAAGVAVVALGVGGDFSKLELQLQDAKQYKKTDYGFSIGGISFFQGVSKQGYFSLLMEQYDFIIFDMGTNHRRYMAEFMSCSKRIVLGSHLEWRIGQYDTFLEDMEYKENERKIEDKIWNDTKKFEYVDVTPFQGSKYFFTTKGKRKLKRMPIIEDVFTVSDELKKTYRSFL